MAITPNMGMLLPIVSTTVGPLYAFENNQAFSVIDSHNHAPGNGAPIPTSALSIDADLPINSFNVTLIRSSRYTSNVSPLSLPSDIRSVYVVGGDLYYNNGIGQQIQITAGAALNATTVGGIGGDYATSSASVFYTSFSSTFTFWSASNTPAIIDVGPVTIREVAVSPFGITLNSPSALSADYSLTLPNALPASTKIMTLDNVGNIAAVYGVDNSTIQILSNVIQVPTNGITATQLASNSVTSIKIPDSELGIIKLNSNLRTATVFTASGSYVVPDNVSYIRVIACGGGGGGGGGQNGPIAGGGGGAGAPIFEGIVDVTPGDTLTITIGAGGVGGVNGSGGAPGSAGGVTTVSGTGLSLVVLGGTGGGGGSVPNGDGAGGVGYKGTQNGGNGSGSTPGSGYIASVNGGFGTGGSRSGITAGGGGGSIGIGGTGSTSPGNGTDGAGGGGLTAGVNGSGGTGGNGKVIIYVL